MTLAPIKARAEKEREQLAAGRPPEARMKHPVQRAAAKALAFFFILMLALTLLSRAADGVTVAQVKVAGAKTGVLTNRTTASGAIQAQGDLELTLPAGIRVSRIAVEKGARVQAGDVLLELDQEGLARAVEKLENDLTILDLKLAGAAQGQSPADTDAILSAQAALEEAEIALQRAQEDWERLKSARITAEGRAGEDLSQAQADFGTALQALADAEVKAKEDIVKAAQEKLDQAAEALSDAQENAAEAINAAEQAVKSAEDQRNGSADQYLAAQRAYEQARSNFDDAQQALSDAVDSGDEAAIAAAKSAYVQAQNSLSSAESALVSADNSEASGNNAVIRAKESLKSTREKWEARVEKAEEAYKKAEEALRKAREVGDVSGEAAVIAAKSALDAARRTVETAQRSTEDAAVATEEQLLAAQRGVETAERGVAAAQRGVESAQRQAAQARSTQQSSARQNEIERLGYVSERREAERKLEALRAVVEAGGVLTAPISGTVLFIPEETGLTQEGARAAVISRGDLGFEFSAKLTQEEAEHLSVGMEGKLSFTQDGKNVEVEATVTALGMADKEGNVALTASLPQRDYPDGVSAKLEITRRSQQYQSCLPLSALRSDGSAQFVLALREKETVMGVEQTVVKVPVTVLDQDSERVAVEGLGWDEQVVVSAGKPIGAGDRVRVMSDEA